MFKNKFTRKLLYALIFIALLCFIIANISAVSSAFVLLTNILAPILGGVCIAFILNMPLRALEKLWTRIFKRAKRPIVQKLRRPVCLVLCFIICLALIAALIVMLVPQLTKTAKLLIERLPEYIVQVEHWYETLSVWLEEYSITLPALKLDAAKIIDYAKDILLDRVPDLVSDSINIAGSLFGAIFDIVLAIAISIYILEQKEKILSQLRRGLSAFFSEKAVAKVVNFTLLTNRSFSSFISGQFLEALILGTLCCIGMLIFGMPYAVLISVVIAVSALIPVFGPVIGTVIGAFFLFLESPITALWFVVFIVVLQQIDNNFIYPRVVGKHVGLPGLWVLISVTIGSSFGVVGMLVSVPLCSVIYCLIRQTIDMKEKAKARMSSGSEPEDDFSEFAEDAPYEIDGFFEPDDTKDPLFDENGEEPEKLETPTQPNEELSDQAKGDAPANAQEPTSGGKVTLALKKLVSVFKKK